jgi:CxxC-x17-CxxC domain-containing protein
MKKSSKGKESAEGSVSCQDIVGMINKLQEQVTLVERKLDVIVSRLPQNPVQAKSQQPVQPAQSQQQFRQPQQNQQNQNFQQRHGGFNSRPMFKVVCADCHKDAEIPFKPTPGRAVYCKECFAKRKNNIVFKNDTPRPTEVKPVTPLAAPQIVSEAKPKIEKAKKSSAKKAKPAAKKSKK